MATDPPQLAVSRVFAAPRALVFRAFTDPAQVATWWGPNGSSMDHMDFDVRPGGHERWTVVSADDPDVLVRVSLDLTAVAEADLLEGVMHISGRLPEDFPPYESRFRIEFHDEPDGRTRLEIRQWLPAQLAGPSNQGWLEAFDKLEATLHRLQAAAADIGA